MVHQKHYIKRKKLFSFFHKGSVVFALPFIVLPLYSSFYSNDFRDQNNSFHISGELNPKSNKLALNIFENEWEKLPSHKQKNYAFGGIYFDMYYSFKEYKIGVFAQEDGVIYINDGFLETIFEANNDFNTFLHSDTINRELSTVKLDGYTNVYKTKGAYIQKILSLGKYQTLSVKMKFLVGEDIQNISVSGYNTQDHFYGKLTYYYKQKNYVTHKSLDYNPDSGYGMSSDLEYIYNDKKLYIYAGLYNFGGFIQWNDIMKMEYTFDSNTRYKGDDGYMHRRPFGVGFYEEHVHYRQNLPLYYKGICEYGLYKNITVGSEVSGYKSILFNQPFARVFNDNYAFKVGYIIETQSIIFALDMPHISFEVSNNFSFSQTVLETKVHIWF